MDKTIYGKGFKIQNIPYASGEPHLIINTKLAKHDESGWMTYYVEQNIAIPLETVYEILDTLGVKYKKKF